jgi:cell division protein FtsW
VAFGCGGYWGVGLGKGIQKLFYLPQPHSDFIFAVIGEELGLVGVIAVILMFYALVFRGFMIAIKSRDIFLRCLAFGITSLIGIQALINMAVTMGLAPTKGLPLPLISLGGTSILVNLAGIGILMAISRTNVSERDGGRE